MRQHREEVVLAAVLGAQFVGQMLHATPREYLVGDLGGEDEDAGRQAQFVAQRLVDEVEERLLAAPVHAAVQLRRRLVADLGLAGAVDAVEEGREGLAAQFGQPLEQRLADHVAVADERAVGGVDQVEDVVGAGEHGDAGGRLHEQLAEVLAPLFGRPRGLFPLQARRQLARDELEELAIPLVEVQSPADAECDDAGGRSAGGGVQRQHQRAAREARRDGRQRVDEARRVLGPDGARDAVEAIDVLVRQRRAGAAPGHEFHRVGVPQPDAGERDVGGVAGHRGQRGVDRGGDGLALGHEVAQHLGAPIGQHRFGDLEHGLQDARDAALVVAQRAEREGEEGVLVETVASDGDVFALDPPRAAVVEHVAHPGMDQRVGVGPRLLVSHAERARMARAEDGGVAGVVDLGLLGPPEQDRRRRHVQHHLRVAPQRLRPRGDRPERRARPVDRVEQLAQGIAGGCGGGSIVGLGHAAFEFVAWMLSSSESACLPFETLRARSR